MITDKDLEFDTNSDGEMIDNEGEVVFCSNFLCESPAAVRRVVSCESPHDQTRDYCQCCEESYAAGVQHGRFHEAALHGTVPGIDPSQDPPNPRARS